MVWKGSRLDLGNHCYINKPYLLSLAALLGRRLHNKALHTFGTGDLPKLRRASQGAGAMAGLMSTRAT